MNKIPTLTTETIALLKALESAAVVMFGANYDSSEVFNRISDAYGEALGYDVVRMIVNSANLLNSYDQSHEQTDTEVIGGVDFSESVDMLDSLSV